MRALIGDSGFVGSTLKKQVEFAGLFRSSNIDLSTEYAYDTVICAAAPAQKWLANRDPDRDRANIIRLIEHLKSFRCRFFILISTIDVFGAHVGVDEETHVEEVGLHPYGLNRRHLEKFVESWFKNYLIVRLPGLVGPGLRKNPIFDLLNDNNINAIDSRSVLQFYPMTNLWYDIETAIGIGVDIVHLTAEPTSLSDISSSCFGRPFEQSLQGTPAQYDMRSRYAGHFGPNVDYQYNRRDTIHAVRAYAQWEPRTVKAEA